MRIPYHSEGKKGKASSAAILLAAASLIRPSQAHVVPYKSNNGTASTHTAMSGSSSPASSTSVSGNSTAGSLQSCLQNLSPVFPNSQNYGQDSAPFNQAFSWKPAAIVYPRSTNDVAQAVKCAASSGYKVSARAGGHSYAAFGLGGEK